MNNQTVTVDMLRRIFEDAASYKLENGADPATVNAKSEGIEAALTAEDLPLAASLIDDLILNVHVDPLYADLLKNMRQVREWMNE